MEFFTERWSTIRDFFTSQKIPGEWSKFITWRYWTEDFLPSSSPYYAFNLGLVALVIAMLIVWRWLLRRRHQQTPVYDLPLSHIPNIVIFVVLITASYLFFRTQQIAYLSSRLVILIAAIVVLVWIAYLIAYLYLKIPAKRRSYLERERFFRYLPKVQERKR